MNPFFPFLHVFSFITNSTLGRKELNLNCSASHFVIKIVPKSSIDNPQSKISNLTRLDMHSIPGYSEGSYSHNFSVLLLHVLSTARSPNTRTLKQRIFCGL